MHRPAPGLPSVTLATSSGPTIVPSNVHNTNTMSANGSVSKPSQRSSSSTRSSRRATLSVGPGGGNLLSNGSLSPQRVLRTKVLREKSNEGSGYLSSDANASAGVKAKPASKG